MAGDTGVVEADIIVGDVVVSFDDTDVLVVLSLVSHDSRGLLYFVFLNGEKTGKLSFSQTAPLIVPDQSWTVTAGLWLDLKEMGGILARHYDGKVRDEMSKQVCI